MHPSRTRAPLLAAALLTLLPACSGSARRDDPRFPPGPDPRAEITAEEIRDHVDYLAADALAGRRSGTPECDVAAEYIARAFRQAGLEPAGENGTWYQTFDVPVGTELGEGNRLSWSGGEGPAVQGEEFIPLGFSASRSVTAPVVFAGYGISSETPPYDDYAGVDVRDKIVLVLRHAPREGQDPPFLTGHAAFLAQLRFKAIAAREAGAAGLLVVDDPLHHAEAEDALLRIGDGAGDSGIPAVHVKRSWLQPLLDAAGVDLLAVQKEIDETLRPRSFALGGVEVTLEVDLRRPRRPTHNVLGKVPGADSRLRREAILFGAHYDHLGLGGEGSLAPDRIGEIHNGADDNASGTAGLIAAAEAFGLADRPPRRTILFAAFSGEEQGLLGSAHYVRHPTHRIDRTVAMVNFDMIGRGVGGRTTAEGVQTGEGFREMLEELNEDVGLDLGFVKAGFGGSDHQSFIRMKIPVIFFFSGMHEDYHRPSDDADKIVADTTAKIVRLAAAAARRIDATDEPPTFVEPAPSAAAHADAGAETRGRPAWLGTVPDMSGEAVDGVLLSGVSPGSPAEKAGMRKGDILVRIAEKTIGDLWDMSYALQARKPGDEIELEVLRDGERMSLTATLGVREER